MFREHSNKVMGVMQADRMLLKTNEIVEGQYLLLGPYKEAPIESIYLVKSLNGNQLYDLRLINGYQLSEFENWQSADICSEFAQLNIPHLLVPLHISIYKESCYYIMQRVEGVTLAEILQYMVLSKVTLLNYLRQLATIIDQLAFKSVAYFIINPENIVIDQRESDVYLLYPGYRNIIAQIPALCLLRSSNPVRNRDYIRIPMPLRSEHYSDIIYYKRDQVKYLAPEILAGEQPDLKSHVYLLALVGYEMLTGENLSASTRADQIVICNNTELFKKSRLKEYTNCANEINAVFHKALSQSRIERYSTCMEFYRAFDNALITSAIESDKQIFDQLDKFPENSLKYEIKNPEEIGEESDILKTADSPVKECQSGEEVKRAVNQSRIISEAKIDIKNAQFTVYRPRQIQSLKWYDLLFFAHSDDVKDPNSAESADTIQEVTKLAAQILGEKRSKYIDTRIDSSFPIPHSSSLRIIPTASGIEFNPPEASFRFYERLHKIIFSMRSVASPSEQTVYGKITVFLGIIIYAEIPLQFIITNSPHSTNPILSSTVKPYRKIFGSYSHKDQSILDAFRLFYQAIGDEFYYDAKLKSGEVWDDKIKNLIEQADIFQLFWSKYSMYSPYVKNEYEYALTLDKKSDFIHPVFWETPMPKSDSENLPPPQLAKLHFQYISPLSLNPYYQNEGNDFSAAVQGVSPDLSETLESSQLTMRDYGEATPTEVKAKENKEDSSKPTKMHGFYGDLTGIVLIAIYAVIACIAGPAYFLFRIFNIPLKYYYELLYNIFYYCEKILLHGNSIDAKSAQKTVDFILKNQIWISWISIAALLFAVFAVIQRSKRKASIPPLNQSNR